MALKSKVAIEVDIKNVKKITELKDSLKQLRKEQRQYEKDVKGGVKVTKESADAYIKNEKAIAKNSKALRETNKEVKGVTKSSNGMAKQIVKGTAVIGLAVGAFRTITNVIGTAVKGFRDFEFQMAKVQAITGATNEEFLLLTQSAKDLGRSTFFTAQQVAELQTNFGKLGFTTQEILDAQEATLNLATATDSDLARAAIVAGSAVRGFGLDASETQRVVDVMAVSFTSSALDLEKFQTAMTKVAPIAKSAGFSIEDTTAIMAQLSDAGIEASIAGTSLRNILLKMQNPNSDLVQSFGKTIHSLDELVPALTKFSEEGGSLAEIMEVVDDRQAAAFEQMITSRDKTVQLRDALVDANGAAEEMARIVGDTLEGALKRSESATQGFAIAFVEIFGTQLKNITDGFANFVNKLTDFIEIPVSEKLEGERIAMNDLFNALQNTNISQDTRNKLVTELNLKYGEYLPNIVTEKTNLEDLKKAQVEANAAMLQRVTILAAEERLTEIRKKQILNEEEAAKLVKETVKLQREEQEALANTNKRLQTSFSGVDVVVSNADLSLRENSKAVSANKEEAEKLAEEYETAATAALNLGVDVDALVESLNTSTGSTNTQTDAILSNTTAKKDNALATDFLSTVSEDYFNSLTEDVLNGTATIEEQEQKLRDFQIELLDNLLLDEQLTFEQRVKLETKLNNLKLQNHKVNLENIQKEKDVRQAEIDGVAQLGDQLIQLAGDDKKLQGVRKAGVAISAAAAVANNVLALSNAAVGVTEQAKLKFPENIVAMLTTLATVMSLIANLKTLKDSFGDGGVVKEFANGGMVHGPSHAQGGVKFAVGGRVNELEGGEAVINKRSTAMFKNELSAMNVAGGGVKFADGGLLSSPQFAQAQFSANNQAQMMGAMQGQRKVVVVEADITDSQSSVSVIQANATF